MKKQVAMTILLTVFSLAGRAAAESPAPQAIENLLAGRFRWTAGPPLVLPLESTADTYFSVKDPSFVRHGDRWHLFCTVRAKARSHQVEYLTFADWSKARDHAERQFLTILPGYFCAPQVFYFRPHKKWYLVYQTNDPGGKPELRPACSTADDLARPESWSKPILFYKDKPQGVKGWIDFWVICDERHAYLFFTSLDGRMWRARTRLDDFPAGWNEPEVCLLGDIFEASHTYRLKGRLKGLKKYLTVVEAQNGPRRYYKAYLADRLDGPWKPLADTLQNPFAAPENVRFIGPRWSDSFSHGELVRSTNDETLEVDPARLRFVFQGVKEEDARGKVYGQIPWRLGMLEAAEE